MIDETIQNVRPAPGRSRSLAEARGNRRSATIRDVARLAGVSVGTVSHVLNGSRKVRPETELKVRVAIRDLGYVPNAVARSLVTRRTSTIGVAITSITNLVNAEMVSGIAQVAKRSGYRLLLAESGMDSQPYLDECVTAFCEKGMDGAIGKFPPPAAERLLAHGIPVVCFDVDLERLPADGVVPDYRAGVRQAIQHLHALGHTRIGFLSAEAPWQRQNARLHAYLEAMREVGLPRPEAWVAWGDWSVPGGEQAMGALLDLPEPPTAVLAANDLMALGAVQAAEMRGLAVPRDLSVVGIDNSMLCDLVRPRLSTVTMHPLEIGLQAMELLLSRIATSGRLGSRAPRRVSLETEFIPRESTLPPRR